MVRRLLPDGQGEVHLESGKVLAVPGTLPGQEVVVIRLGNRGGRGRGLLVSVLRQGTNEVAALCQHASVCGGCTFQSLEYQAQLDHLKEVVQATLERNGIAASVLPVLPSPIVHGYRNKMEFTFGDARWVASDEPSDADRSFALGMHLPGRWNRVLDLKECTIAHPTMVPILHAIREISRSLKILPWSVVQHTGTLRHLVLRVGVHTGDVMVHLVTSGEQKDLVQSLMTRLRDQHREITTVVETVHRGAASISSLGSQVLHYGGGTIRESVLGRTFLISPQSFFQTNTIQAEALFREILRAADPKPQDRVLDLFCGSGVIGLILASHVAEVTGYEVVPSAVEDAERNAVANGITNARFVLGDVALTLQDPKSFGQMDLVVVDPPRAGIPKPALQFLVDLAPRRIVYVSCNVKSAATELGVLFSAGYQLLRTQPVDLFPHTPHVECVFTLAR